MRQRRSVGAASVVSSMTMRSAAYTSDPKTSFWRPIVAKIRPTSPRGSMPRPISSLSPGRLPTPTAATILPTTATTSSAAAMPSTFGWANSVTSASTPMRKKNTGMKIAPTERSSLPTRCPVGERLRQMPATNAPMIGASLAVLASWERARMNASASPIIVPEDRATRWSHSNTAGASRMPITTEATRNATAMPMTLPVSVTEIEPTSTRRTTTVRITRPRTSSATAAPSTVRASTVVRARRSPKTRAVMPTLVAVRAAPTKIASLVLNPRAAPTPAPPMNGSATPMSATLIAARPTAPSSSRSISRPTSKSRRMTPISPSVSMISPSCTQPSIDGPARTPTTISPTTAGRPMRSETSAASLASRMMMRMSTRPSGMRPGHYGATVSRP